MTIIHPVLWIRITTYNMDSTSTRFPHQTTIRSSNFPIFCAIMIETASWICSTCRSSKSPRPAKLIIMSSTTSEVPLLIKKSDIISIQIHHRSIWKGFRSFSNKNILPPRGSTRRRQPKVAWFYMEILPVCQGSPEDTSWNTLIIIFVRSIKIFMIVKFCKIRFNK